MTAVERLTGRPPAAGGDRLLAIGAPPRLIRAWRAMGWRVSVHTLDTGPAADVAGRPFSPPITTWPQPDSSYDMVVIYDQLAHVVDEEAAIAEAGRVLRPGGRLVVRVPQSGPLAWLDGANLYRYLRDFTKRGRSLAETRGVGWRRHYPRRDVRCLLTGRFGPAKLTTEGVGLVEIARGLSLLLCCWLLRWPPGYERSRPLLDVVARLDDRLSAGPFGYHMVATAERAGDNDDFAVKAPASRLPEPGGG